MSNPFIAELRTFSFGFPPRGWATCNGQLLPINQNQALFSILGTTFGGDGVTTFALPNLQGRVPVGFGSGTGGTFTLGQLGGAPSVSLLGSQVPQHIHTATGSTGLSTGMPGSTVLPGTLASGNLAYTTSATSLVPMGANSVASAGLGQAHENRQPTLALNICIALQGIFPSRN